ncbi:MAG: hypothetical protein CSA09_04360 [Candidatus Contendobacter odensis]|uniref:Tc1-like transposase DDE domain-containing protein n=1 Tax=Candidatus Contendibacter odensensis TaxID=1400860 RepID=A0A2G6PED4_9GAMM|nr:MAG: hypothetical protein CSA09_04360 [Candidatus Contendobacter odensis]
MGSERVRHPGVSRNGAWYAPGQLGISRKKTPGYRGRDPGKRLAYKHWHDRAQQRGKAFVYVDESGFEPTAGRRYPYAPKGARIGAHLACPLLLDGTCNTTVFNTWLEQLNRISPPSKNGVNINLTNPWMT